MSSIKMANGSIARPVSIHRYCEVIHQFRWLFILFSLAFASAMGAGAVHLKSTTDNRVFFGPENPELKAFEALEATYTERNDVLIALAPKSGNVFTKDTLSAIHTLTEEMWQAPHSTRIDSITNFQHSYADGDELIIGDLVSDPASLTAAQIAKIRRVATSEPLLTGLLISEDARVTGISANFLLPHGSPTAADEIVAFVRKVIADLKQDHPNIDIHLTGNIMLMSAFGEANTQDMTTLLPLVFLVISIFLLILLRSLVAVLIALLLATTSAGTAMGFAGWSGIVLNAGSGSAPLIVLTMALAYSVHLLSKFIDDYRSGASKRVAILNTVEGNLSPVFLTSLTTAIGFLSMNASDAPPFHDLGNIVAVGVVSAFVFAFTLLPALLDVVRISRDGPKPKEQTFFKTLSHFVVRRPLSVATICIAVMGVLATGITKIELNENWVHYFDERFQFRKDTDFVLKNLTGIDILEFSISTTAETGIADPEYLKALDDFSAWLRDNPAIVNVNALSDILKKLNMNLHDDDPAFYAVPETGDRAAQYLLLYE
ncbi:MAG: MMPL family transporter, partial [Phycisphaerales bacterium]|nr:MMPL family transporter [Phycisphaerales bacterium]